MYHKNYLVQSRVDRNISELKEAMVEALLVAPGLTQADLGGRVETRDISANVGGHKNWVTASILLLLELERTVKVDSGKYFLNGRAPAVFPNVDFYVLKSKVKRVIAELKEAAIETIGAEPGLSQIEIGRALGIYRIKGSRNGFKNMFTACLLMLLEQEGAIRAEVVKVDVLGRKKKAYHLNGAHALV
jgi:hypothetical protein